MLVAASPPEPVLKSAWDQPASGNPLLPAYAADPSIVQDQGRWYIFATIDPWGGDHVGLWQSTNGRDWSFSQPAWPTKQAATSPTSGDAMVWAPSVVKAHGRWWMYVSVGSEVWVGSAPSPEGPWADANQGKPLIPGNAMPGYHMIDAEAFIDDDGQAYLAWGSGLHWVNGHCFVAKLAPDMVHLEGPPRDVTPAHYFEAPFLFKAGGRYYLTYSAGNTTADTYQVRYATGPTPMGPSPRLPTARSSAPMPRATSSVPAITRSSAAAGRAISSTTVRLCHGAARAPKRCGRWRWMFCMSGPMACSMWCIPPIMVRRWRVGLCRASMACPGARWGRAPIPPMALNARRTTILPRSGAQGAMVC
jgi:hypothetical protein